MINFPARSRLTAMLGAASAIAVVAASGAAYAQEQARNFDIPAQGLLPALLEYQRQSDIPVVVRAELVRDRQAPAVRGYLTPTEALDRLLSGSGLTVQRRAEGGLTLVAQASASPNQLGAADPAAASGSEGEDRIVVTGSRIRGRQSASPTQTVTREEIANSGYSQVGEIVRGLPQNFGGGHNPGVLTTTNSANANLTGASTANLRGLGPDATLVLVNGHRLPTDGTTPAPDISVIPVSAISRVEVVTDGASALYGSDAIAGVMNFILVDDYDGAELSARVGGTSQGGGAEQTYNAMAGKSWTTGRLLGGVEYSEQEKITASQRGVTRDAAPSNTLLPAQERGSAFLSARQQLTPWITLSADGLYMDRHMEMVTQNTLAGTAQAKTADVTSFLIGSRLEFDLPNDWTAQLEASLGRGSDYTDTRLSSGGGFWDNVRNETQSVEVSANGAALSLPTGDLRLAVGAGFREENHRFWGSSNALRTGNRDITYGFVEVLAPLVTPSSDRFGLHQLDLSVAARVEEYSDFGSTTNPKVGLRYMPTNDLTLRATWGESFKAPTFTQMLVPSTLTLRTSAQVGGGGTPGQAMIFFAGNPDLLPERSTSWTAGFDWSPDFWDGFDLSLTYFDIDYTDRVISPLLSTATALSNPIHAPFIIRNPSVAVQNQFIAMSSRFTNSAGQTYNPNSVIALIDARYVNATSLVVDGLDLAVRQSFDIGIGNLDLFASASWLDLRQKTLPTSPMAERTGTIFNPSDVRARGGMVWRLGDLTSAATINYVGGATDNAVTPFRDIGPWTTVDLNFRYQLPDWGSNVEGLELALSVINALDREPPFAMGAGALTTGVRYDSTNTSAVGQSFAVTARQRF